MAATNPEPLRAGRPEPGAAGAYLGELFAVHGRTVLGLCRLLLRDPVEAEDAAQQVFLSAHRSVLRGRFPQDAPAWLAAIARNECRARIRRRMREPLGLPELPDDLPDPLATAVRSADLDALWVALSELPRRQRRAFLLREMGGMSYGELGTALGVTRPAVESLLFRARRQLRRALTGANAALVPIALRDQLAQLIPGFGAAPAASIPVVAKIAVVAAGVGLGTAGVVALPRAHTHVMRPREAMHVRHVRPRLAVAAPEPSSAEPPVTKHSASPPIAVSRSPDEEHQTARGEQDRSDEAQPMPRPPSEAAPVQRSEQDSVGGADSGQSASDGGSSSQSGSGGD